MCLHVGENKKAQISLACLSRPSGVGGRAGACYQARTAVAPPPDIPLPCSLDPSGPGIKPSPPLHAGSRCQSRPPPLSSSLLHSGGEGSTGGDAAQTDLSCGPSGNIALNITLNITLNKPLDIQLCCHADLLANTLKLKAVRVYVPST